MSNQEEEVIIWLLKDLLKSEAYTTLTKAETNIFNEILMRRQMKEHPPKHSKNWYIANNGDITLTYNKIQELYNYSKSTISKSYTNLVLKGLVDIPKQDVVIYNDGKRNDATKFFVSERWRDFGKEGFKEVIRKIKKSKKGLTKANRQHRLDEITDTEWKKINRKSKLKMVPKR